MCDDLLLRFSRFFSLKMSPINMEMNIFANENKILTKSISKRHPYPQILVFFAPQKALKPSNFEVILFKISKYYLLLVESL